MPRAAKTNTRPIAVDLFSGAGGMSLGFEQAGFDVMLAVDYDPYHVSAHARNFPYGEVIHGSVADLSGQDILDKVGDTVHVIFGGPPCQGFSHMGLRDILDPRSTLVAQFARIVAEVRPIAFVMENVPGMQTGRTAAIFQDAIERFRAAGYAIAWPPQRLNAKNFGVPQDRERLFVIGTREELGIIVPYPAGRCEGQPGRPTVLETLADLPVPAESGDSQPYPPLRADASEYARVARGLSPDPSDRSRERAWDKNICTGCAKVVHSPETTALYAATPPGQMVPGHKLPRLSPGGVCPTLRAGSNSERGSHTAPRPVHPIRPTCITVREAARLHGYPDWFVFFPGKWHAYQQIGNSVCPPVARAVGAEIVRALGLAAKKPKGAPVALSGTFDVPAKGTHYRRIVQMEEYPKVLAELLATCGSSVGTVIDRKQVEAAYAKTGAVMPRIRPEQFFSALARSRNVNRLLKPFHDHGVTLALHGEGGDSAQVVPLDTPASIGDKDAINVASASLLDAVVYGEVTVDNDGGAPISLQVLADGRLIGLLAGEHWKALRPDGSLFWDDRRRFSAALAQKGQKHERVVVTTCVGHQLPPRRRLADAMVQNGCHRALIAARLTREHIFLASFGLENGQAIERHRVVIRMATRSTDRLATG
ncbi:MAG: DNA cytosine methyltransferase [Deltaproteobacteria bacterium]|nr:DNA cytosine methyltransferase [Deltaproteobacteria bacterium]